MPAANRPDPHRDPIGPFLHYLMAECGLSPNTLAAYRSDIVRFSRWRKEHSPGPLVDLDISTLTGYVDYLSGLGLAPSSVSRNLAALSTFYRFLIYDGRLSENVAKLLVAPAVWDRLPTVLGPSAVDRLLANPDREQTIGRRDRAALETLYATGCRASEVVGLRPVDLDLAGGSARCVGKGEQGADRSAGRQGARGSLRVHDPRPSSVDRRPGRRANDLRHASRPPLEPGRALEDRQVARPGGRFAGKREPPYPPA